MYLHVLCGRILHFCCSKIIDPVGLKLKRIWKGEGQHIIFFSTTAEYSCDFRQINKHGLTDTFFFVIYELTGHIRSNIIMSSITRFYMQLINYYDTDHQHEVSSRLFTPPTRWTTLLRFQFYDM